MEYDATSTLIFNIPPYHFFAVIGVVVSSSLFIMLLLKFNYDISIYTKNYFLSGIGLLAGAKLFGFFTGLYSALANREVITLGTFLNTGIVFYGGLIGFITAFLLLCKTQSRKMEYGVIDITAVCIPLFHVFARLGCFSAGCCYGLETHMLLSITYTTRIGHEIVTASRFPVQIFEAFGNALIFIILITFLLKTALKGHLMIVYLSLYAVMRIILEFFRGDAVRGVWNGISFSQVISGMILVFCLTVCMRGIEKGDKHEVI